MTVYDFALYIFEEFGALILAFLAFAWILFMFMVKFIHLKLSERIKNLEQDFQEALAEKNSFHAISKASLEIAFQKKINVYEELLRKANERARFIDQSPLHDEPDSAEESKLKFAESIIQKIEDNVLYVTSNLAEKYDAWYQAAKPYIKSSNDSEYESWQHSFGTDDDKLNAYYAGLPEKLKMINKTERELEEIICCIYKDVRDIRSSLERPSFV